MTVIHFSLQSSPPLLIPLLPFPLLPSSSITPPLLVSSLHLAGSYSDVDGSTVCKECSPGLICKCVCVCVCVCVCGCVGEWGVHVFVCPVLSPHCKLPPERSLLTSVATDQAPESLLYSVHQDSITITWATYGCSPICTYRIPCMKLVSFTATRWL